MDVTKLDVKKDGYKKKIVEPSKKNTLTDRLFMEVKPEDVLLSRVPKPQISHFRIRKLFLQHIHDLTKNIPRRIASLEEKFISYCLELIHSGASRKNSWIIPSKSHNFSPVVSSRSGYDSLFLVSFDTPDARISSYCDLIIGSITSSSSMMNISYRPSTCQLEAMDDDDDEIINTLEIREDVNSAAGLQAGPLNKLQTERIVPEYHSLKSESLHKMLVSLPNVSSSSSSSAYYHGTLHCSWNDGFPYYAFSIEDKGNVLITANLLKVEPLGYKDKVIDYVYMFHSRAKDVDFLGEMSVSTSFELCQHGTEIRETRFVLCAPSDTNEEDTFPLDPTHRKNNRISKPELATIVMRDHIHDSQSEVGFGGWGLKFLKKDQHCESCIHDTSSFSTSMNVLIPAGFHSRPRTGKSGGPSSLIERWSGGSCDCGGWDLGCPLTVLHAQLNHENGASFSLSKQGCKKRVTVLKMAGVRESYDGLYDIRYKSSLSALQSLSIAVATIHSRSPSLIVTEP